MEWGSLMLAVVDAGSQGLSGCSLDTPDVQTTWAQEML